MRMIPSRSSPKGTLSRSQREFLLLLHLLSGNVALDNMSLFVNEGIAIEGVEKLACNIFFGMDCAIFVVILMRKILPRYSPRGTLSRSPLVVIKLIK